MRKVIAASGIALMAVMTTALLSPVAQGVESVITTVTTITETTPTETTPTETTPAPPEGCTPRFTQKSADGAFYDGDCVTFTFTKQPPASTASTDAEISWEVDVFGIKGGSDWANWTDKECKLDGVVVTCPTDPKIFFTGLKPGPHVFVVTAIAPQLFEESSVRSSDAAAVTIEPCDPERADGDLSDCFRVTGQVAWTVEAPATTTTTTTTTTTAETPAPAVTAQAPAATPQACLSRRTLTIRIRERQGEKIASAKVVFNGKTIATSRRTTDGRVVAKIDFRKLPAGRFSVQIKAKLTNGQTRTYTRRYFTCEPKRPPSNNLESPKAL